MPSGQLKIIGNLTVNKDSTSTVKFDFIADESLHITGNGLYIFAPVIKLETREKAYVKIERRENDDKDDEDFKANVEISDGEMDEDKKISMDIDGNFGEGLKIRKDSKLSIKGNEITEESDLEGD
ncbi:MAG: hypothetical protein AABX00_05145 [Nanoarchaeota archaeon]